MKPFTPEEQQQLIEAFRSIIRKSENALARMKPGTPQTNLLEKRLKAARIGEDVLHARWEDKELVVSKDELLMAKEVLKGLLLMLPSFLEKTKPGSGQRTYIERRIKAFQTAVSYLDNEGN
ncbi:hypothetical protein N5C46_20805 [Rossellomorea vietnamensis]|uniref:Uncharacterized protein n=1 Tax=Rossellomorea vietnamensis TaxID=218284 RepID=A0ACD4C6B6_9BACI|nr:hypothetical protein [Rossellomorea vietnamensis]UXH44047.1 hypothetical protein N5C46_20805 [Rossellomorea vietnamensis]